MIGLNMDPPETCGDCPCSYWIQYGEHADKLMCEAIGKIYPWKKTAECLVNECSLRPDYCPMIKLPDNLIRVRSSVKEKERCTSSK